MRIYELTIILDPNLDKEAVNSELDKLTGMVKDANGKILEIQHLGMRRLTFDMNGNSQGNYYSIYFTSVPEVLTKMDASMKLNEAVLRSMTIVLKPSEYSAPEKPEAADDSTSTKFSKPEPDEDTDESVDDEEDYEEDREMEV